MKTLNDFPDYREAMEKLAEMQLLHHRLNQEVQGAADALAAAGVKDAQDEAATALLEGRDVAAAVASTKRSTLEQAFDDKRERRRIAALAVEKARERVDAVKRARGLDIAREAAPEYRETVRELAKALLAAARVSHREHTIRDELYARSVSFTAVFDAQPFTGLGRPDDSQSRLGIWLRDAVARGYLTVAEVREWAGELPVKKLLDGMTDAAEVRRAA